MTDTVSPMATHPGDDFCPRCGSTATALRETSDRNRRVKPGTFTYRRCEACRVVWLPDPPADLESYYPAEYHAFASAEELTELARGEDERLGMVTDLVPSGRLIEVGPSQGVFSVAARLAGFDVVGLEMDSACVDHLRAAAGVQAVHTSDPTAALREQPASDAVVMWHVFEHIVDPWSLVSAAAAALRPGGVFAVATPNPASLQHGLFGTHWVHFDAPRHVQLVPLPALRDECAKHGLVLRRATTNDRIGLDCDHLGWERSPCTAPKLRRTPRLAHELGLAAWRLAGPIERRGLRGSTYTAVFQKPHA